MMSSSLRRLLLACFLCCGCALHAQTYTPKTIVFNGAADDSRASLLAITGLTPGAPITKQQIEAALQKLGDTGMFTGIAYTVNDKALTFTLTPDPAARKLPVRFTNFVWWTPDELTHEIQARVPQFDGSMPPNGLLTDQVEAALVSIAHEKGLTITILLHEGGGTLEVSIESPPILFGNLTVPSVQPLAGPTIADLQQGLRGEDFDDAINTGTIQHDVTSIYRNAGYLDATVSQPVFSAPRPQGNGYAVDASVDVHPGSLYTIAAVQVSAPPPFDPAALRTLTGLKPGQTVSPRLTELARLALLGSVTRRGYLTAHVEAVPDVSESNHGVIDTFTVTPGNLFHLARISVQAGLGNLGDALQHDKRLAAGVVADDTVIQAAYEIIKSEGDLEKVLFHLEPDPADNTASLVVSLKQPPPPQAH